MKSLTIKEAEKECREEARKRGLTFKKIAGPEYQYVGRKTGKIYRSTDKIGTAFEIACSDELDIYKED